MPQITKSSKQKTMELFFKTEIILKMMMSVLRNLRMLLKTSQALALHSHANGQEKQQNTEEISNAEITVNVDINRQGAEIYINISRCSVSQFGSETKALEVQSCKLCRKNCYSSSDEEREASVALKISEVQADSQAHVNMLIYSSMPVIPKRGCMNTSHYFLIVTELKDFRSKGDFDGHEQLIETQIENLSRQQILIWKRVCRLSVQILSSIFTSKWPPCFWNCALEEKKS